MYFDIAPAIPLPSNKDLFTYQSDEELMPGTIVRIPFGRRQVGGVVIQKVKKPPYNTKPVSRVYPAPLTPEQLAFGARIAGLTLGGLGFTLRLFYPPSVRAKLPDFKKRSSKNIAATTEAIVMSPASRIKHIAKQVKQVVKDGGQVLIVVPERWMTARFPWAQAFHAGMNVSQAQPVWDDVASGKPVAVVGTQKAFYLPWQNLKLVAIDEAQLPTHKLWDGYPRGDNRWLAALAMETYSPTVCLAAPLPDVDMYYRVRQQKTVTARTWKPASPKQQILAFSFGDRRQGRLLPEDFVGVLRDWKQHKKRVLILHNEKDGSVAKALRSLRLLKKNQIIIGTSAMFAKLQDEKFDFVVWMFPEHALAASDFRSRERAYLLLARLHTMLKSSRQSILLVTRQPSFVDRSLSGTTTKLYKEILAERKKYHYPPFADMVKLTFRGRSVADAEKRVVAARNLLEKKLVVERSTTRILGPFGARPPKGSKRKPEKHLLLLGDLQKIPAAYRATLPDLVDINPEQVL